MTDSRGLDVAIVGMACVFPGAPDLASYFRNLRAGTDALETVPAGRWDPVFFDPKVTAPDRFYCRRGGFIDTYADFDAPAFGVMPVATRGTEPDQLLTMAVATRALADAGYDQRLLPTDKGGVILGRGGYAGAGRTRLEQHVRAAEQLVRSLRDLLPGIPESDLARVKAEFQAQLGPVAADSAIGLVPNLAASRLAHRLDFRGPAFTVDAACASALVAVDQGCRELTSGRCDVIVAGGVHVCHDEAFWSVFCQLGALSRTEQLRAFDRRADGLLIGEGIGIIVLKRRIDAERDGDRVYAVIKGSGVASDGRETTLMSPRVEGQVLALERAWAEAGWDRKTVGFVEAHGTGTPAGDGAELETLARFFGRAEAHEERAALGSVKAMIGHTMPAAGAAGLIKAALAVHHGLLFPQAHCEEPREALAQTRFRILAEEERWPLGTPRRAAVNAFGFGGINAHIVLEGAGISLATATRASTPAAATFGSEAPSGVVPTGPAIAKASRRGGATPSGERMAIFAAATPAALLEAMAAGNESTDPASPARLVVFDPTKERLERAKSLVEKGKAYRGRDGIWFSPKGLLKDGGKLAFVFPGVDSTFEPRVDDLAAHFRLPVPACTTAKNLEEMGVGIVGVNRLLDRVLRDLGLAPSFVAGHSIGEWSGMVATGMIRDADLDAFLADVRPGTLDVPGVVFAAAGCSVTKAEAAMAGLKGIALSHDNCPHQVILCGYESAVDTALARLQHDGVLSQKLPFQSGFHSPLFQDYLAPHRENFARFPLETAREPLWSATTAAPYPKSLDEVRALCIDHLVKPVRFRELVTALHDRGARVFVQVGTGSLTNFVEDTLRGQPHLALSANVKDVSGLEQLRRTAAALFVEGAAIDLARLSPRTKNREPMRLALGVPLVRLSTPLTFAAPAAPTAAPASTIAPIASPLPASHPLASEFTASMTEILRAQAEVLSQLAIAPPRGPARAAHLTAVPRPAATPAVPPGPREGTTTRILSVETLPEVLGHTFFRQPKGWSVVSDLHPVVPMTCSIDIMMEHARTFVPGRVVIGMEDVRAFRWVAVATPVEARVTCVYDGKDRVKVTIGDYCEGVAVLADRYPDAPSADVAPLENPYPAGLSARELYDRRWMFHGSTYQGVVDVGHLGDDGIRGELETGAARGALLDNAGQLFGYWVMARSTKNRLAMPVQIQKLNVFGPHPAPGERLTCTARIRHLDDNSVVADLCLTKKEGVPWATITGWEDRRFHSDDRLWSVLIWPEDNLLADALAPGLVVLEDKYRAAPTRDQLHRRFLGEAERAVYDKVGPRRQRAWLSGRIAAKDAVRSHLEAAGAAPMFPVEVRLEGPDEGLLSAEGPGDAEVHVAVARKDDVYAAFATTGRKAGLHLEPIAGDDAASATMGEVEPDAIELRLGQGEDPALWRASLTAARRAAEAVAPSELSRPLRIRDRGEGRLLVGGQWVSTRRHGDFLIAWTES